MQFEKGERVKNRKMADWGVGEILESFARQKYRVFFVNAGEKTIDSTVADLIRLTGKDAQHPLLDNLRLPGFKKKAQFKTFHQKVDLFLQLFPKGFYDDEYLKDERGYKIEAHELMSSILGEMQMSEKIKAKNYDEICSGALRVVNKTNLIFPNEKMALKDGLQETENKKCFAETLNDLLYGKGEFSGRFRQFASCLESIDASKWTIQTYFPYITFPDEHMFMKPSVTQLAADAFAFELNYKSDLNWESYKTLLKFSRYVGDELSKYEDYLKPRDMIDIQSFIWCSVPGKYNP